MKSQILTKPTKITVYPEKDPPQRFKVIIIGDSNVGKSSIMYRYVDEKFNEKYNATVAVDYSKKSTTIGKERIEVSFWDFSGHPEFSEVRNEFYREASMLLLVFDLTQKRSFDSMDMWVREASDQGAADIPLAIIGNKKDLGTKRSVSENDGMSWARSRKYPYYEVSAATGQNVEESMYEILQKLIVRQ